MKKKEEKPLSSSHKSVPVQNRALSLRQPYAEQVLRGEKKIEYRSIVTHVRGRVYIYASLTPAIEAFEEMGLEPGSLPTGVLVGTVEVVGCIKPWSDHDYNWQLDHPQRLEQPIKPENHPQPVWFKPFKEG